MTLCQVMTLPRCNQLCSHIHQATNNKNTASKATKNNTVIKVTVYTQVHNPSLASAAAHYNMVN